MGPPYIILTRVNLFVNLVTEVVLRVDSNGIDYCPRLWERGGLRNTAHRQEPAQRTSLKMNKIYHILQRAHKHYQSAKTIACSMVNIRLHYYNSVLYCTSTFASNILTRRRLSALYSTSSCSFPLATSKYRINNSLQSQYSRFCRTRNQVTCTI